jgi:anhydro-N-acetylmuramic acid kinase
MAEVYIGLLSGTSMDAIDVAAVDFSGSAPNILATLSMPIPDTYKSACLAITHHGKCNIVEVGELDHWAGELFAEAVLKFIAKHNLAKQDIRAIGSHGQTLWHAPDAKMPFTMQIGDPNIIAQRTGITTIADFRRRDMAAGGKGAPFAPAFHQAVFADPSEVRCIVNIGGISNISVLNNGTVFGYDTGPGNCLMDDMTKHYFNLDYDKDGEIAATGQVNEDLLSACLSDLYFNKPAPKSSGREYFNLEWIEDKRKQSNINPLKPNDILATALKLTAKTISDNIKSFGLSNYKVFICGGGAKNAALLLAISKHLEQPVQTTQDLGIDPDWVEASLFAWLAKQTLTGKKVDLKSITGSSEAILLGGVYN